MNLWNAPVCEIAEGLAPPEDCGGVYGFERLKEILADPENEEHEELLWWYGYSEIRNKSITEINDLLRDAIRVFPEDWMEEEEEADFGGNDYE